MRLMLFLSMVLAASSAHAAKTIVGTWAQSKAECKTDPVLVKPLGIESDYTICHFNTVKRSGNAVRWTGHCFVDSSRRPEAGEGGVVDAVVKNGKLSIDGLGFGIPNLMRCK
jgi:hypothetical protein